jgi:hypothetical protein
LARDDRSPYTVAVAAGAAALIESAAERFAELFTQRVSLAGDRALAGDLAVEARPVFEALLVGAAGAARIDAREPELREAIALASLLGRRAAVLGATPSAAISIAPLLIEALGRADLEALRDTIAAVSIEGYCAERDDQAAALAHRRAADAMPIVELAPGVIAFFPAGVQEPDELERVIDDLGRRLLERDARACVVHLGGLREPDRDRAGRVLAVRSTCAMLGVECVISGLSEAWARAAREARVELEELTIEPDLSAALRRAGIEPREKSGIGQLLKRWISK